MSLFSNPQERKEAVVIAAGVALHALLSHDGGKNYADGGICRAFSLAEAFIKEAEKRA